MILFLRPSLEAAERGIGRFVRFNQDGTVVVSVDMEDVIEAEEAEKSGGKHHQPEEAAEP